MEHLPSPLDQFRKYFGDTLFLEGQIGDQSGRLISADLHDAIVGAPLGCPIWLPSSMWSDPQSDSGAPIEAHGGICLKALGGGHGCLQYYHFLHAMQVRTGVTQKS
jgi:hypothetical protein